MPEDENQVNSTMNYLAPGMGKAMMVLTGRPLTLTGKAQQVLTGEIVNFEGRRPSSTLSMYYLEDSGSECSVSAH